MGRFAKRLDERLTPILQGFLARPDGPAGCACSVTRKGETIYETCLGNADVERGRPVAPDTIYRVYSMSKPITCTAALMLLERGAYRLNDPLSEYLPEFKELSFFRTAPDGGLETVKAARPLLVHDLFTMTSGLPYPEPGTETGRRYQARFAEIEKARRPFSIRDLCRELAGIPLAFEPGTHWMYGFSHDVLGALVEVLSGRRFGAFLQDEVFTPLGMKDASFTIPPEKRDRLAALYDRKPDGALVRNDGLDEDYQPGSAYESGGGGLLMTLADYQAFAQTMARGEHRGVRLLGDATRRLQARNHLTPAQQADFDWPMMRGYGYGLGVKTLVDPAPGGCIGNVGEIGWGGMAGTILVVDPSEELSIVYMEQLLPSLEDRFMPVIRNAVLAAL